MGLARLATRICAAEALKGATWALGRVYDSKIAPIDFMKVDQRQPFIIVVTDDDKGAVQGRDLVASDRELDLIFEVAVATKVAIDAEGETVKIEDTDAGYEVVLDLVERQIVRALQSGQGKWAKLFRSFAINFRMIASRRTADQQQGIRYAARQIVLSVQTLADPPFETAQTTGKWKELLDALAASADLAYLAPILRTEIEAGDLLDWQKATAALGHTESEARAIGLAPAFDPTPNVTNDTEEPPVLVQITADGFTITEASAEENDPSNA
jgi:hypothetical protein